MATTSIPMADLLALTRKDINEYVSTEDDFATETDELLKAHILAAAKQVAAAAPENLVCVREADSTKTEQRPDGLYYTITPIPDNCLRIVSVTSSDWKRPVVAIMPITHPNAGREYCVTPGLGSGPYSPHVYSMGDMLYSHAGSSSTFDTSTFYVAEPAYDSQNDTITNMSKETEEAIAYQAASLYLGATGDQNGSAAAALAARSFVQGWVTGDAQFVPQQQVQQVQTQQ